MKQDTIRKGYRDPGAFVRVRPCDDKHDGKTFLGIYIGDLSARGYSEDGTLNDKPYMHNPCIWVPDLSEYVFGFESWWGEIETENNDSSN